ncbi:hypothetical protein KSS87_002814 [Heliosperma pusillum]|nr:hypothetical protein KSS87_002814 [Heliosperma pusillum]
MKELVGSPGTKTGLILRLGQCAFATASIAVMVSASNFSNFTAFWRCAFGGGMLEDGQMASYCQKSYEEMTEHCVSKGRRYASNKKMASCLQKCSEEMAEGGGSQVVQLRRDLRDCVLCSLFLTSVLMDLHKFALYLIASMGLQVLWSFGLACLDVHALRIKRDLQSPVLVSLFVVGDWVTATLSLAAACSSAGIVVLYSKDLGFCKLNYYPCGKYELSVTFAFLTWFLIAVSSHLMFWILASI